MYLDVLSFRVLWQLVLLFFILILEDHGVSSGYVIVVDVLRIS